MVSRMISVAGDHGDIQAELPPLPYGFKSPLTWQVLNPLMEYEPHRRGRPLRGPNAHASCPPHVTTPSCSGRPPSTYLQEQSLP